LLLVLPASHDGGMDDDDIKLGVLIPIGQAQLGKGQLGPGGAGARELVSFAVRAEELGYSSLWVNDSLISPRIEALAMLAAAAPATRSVTLGTAALIPVLRRPIQAAQTLASIDQLSGGRLVITVGAAFPGRLGEPLHEWSQVPWERRFARLDETVALWRQLWRSPDGGGLFHGELLRFDYLPPMTSPFRPEGPPVWLGGLSESALRRTGRHYDGWLPYPPAPGTYRNGLATVRAAAAGAGRDPGAVTPGLFVTVVISDTAERGREALGLFTQASYGLEVEEAEKIQALAAGPADIVAERLREYIAAGARHLVVRIAATGLADHYQQLEQIIELQSLLKGRQT
jgi:alkanesulfonate monooxygenase SsuD/methylene tetrahydromethanopterin reductase-like flavin-dependent oxidoreductase (luciferase family)